MPSSIAILSHPAPNCPQRTSKTDPRTESASDFRRSAGRHQSTSCAAPAASMPQRDPSEEPLHTPVYNIWAPHLHGGARASKADSAHAGGVDGAYSDAYVTGESSQWAHGRGCYRESGGLARAEAIYDCSRKRRVSDLDSYEESRQYRR